MRKGLFLKCLTYSLALGWTLWAAVDALCEESHSPVFNPVASCFLSEPDSNDLLLQGGTVQGGMFTTCYVYERQTIEVCVHASDPDDDSISISVMNVPPTASFRDWGDGSASLFWRPEFIGPLSSAQSPFAFFFVASDGSSTSQMRVLVNVINVNRNPELSLPESLRVATGNELVFQVRRSDPDLENVTIQALNPPPGASFDESSGMFNWNPQPADTGIWPVVFRAVDGSGGDCVKEADIRVVTPSTFSLMLGVGESILGGVAEVPVILVNSEPVAGMELLIQYDPTVFTFLEAFSQGSRCNDWEYFQYQQESVGLYQQIRIVGLADLPNQTQVLPLSPDSGVVSHIRFKVTTDPYLNGFLIPLEFYSFDLTDNTLSTPQGVLISQEEINLHNGGVLVMRGNTLIGDVNQNGLAYEVGDAVKLAAYIAGTKILTPEQMINADVNQDGRMGTLGDLVSLIKRILEQQTVPKHDDDSFDPEAVARITDEDFRTSVAVDSDVPVGGALVIIRGENVAVENVALAPELEDLDLHTSLVGDEFRILILGQEEKPLPQNGSLLNIEGNGFNAIEVSLSDCQGELLPVKQEREKGSLPPRFALRQNYPNPFNPTTSIRYLVGADAPAEVTLQVYNVAGQLVKTLVDEEKSPGEHQVMWDGKNEQGESVASGVYFYRMSVLNYSENRRMVLLK